MENKTGKPAIPAGRYLKYAIGEIILVVIGILIALQINNWNENRRLQKVKKNIYSIIKTDLKSDINNIDKVFKAMTPRDSVFKKVINKEITKEDYDNCEKCSFILYSYPDITLNSRGITLLENNSTVFDLQNDSLSVEISDFYKYFNTEIGVALTEVEQDYFDNYNYFKNNKPWFGDYINGIKNDELTNYVLNSDDYMNRVRSFYRLFYHSYLGHLKSYKEQAKLMIDKIEME
jgi:hypothetical protein